MPQANRQVLKLARTSSGLLKQPQIFTFGLQLNVDFKTDGGLIHILKFNLNNFKLFLISEWTLKYFSLRL